MLEAYWHYLQPISLFHVQLLMIRCIFWMICANSLSFARITFKQSVKVQKIKLNNIYDVLYSCKSVQGVWITTCMFITSTNVRDMKLILVQNFFTRQHSIKISAIPRCFVWFVDCIEIRQIKFPYFQYQIKKWTMTIKVFRNSIWFLSCFYLIAYWGQIILLLIYLIEV